MPNRLVREGFLDSEPINALSEAAECFLHRLLLVADDAGRLVAHPEFLRARLYPLGTTRTTEEITQLLRECEESGLLRVYAWEGKSYLQIARWQRPGNSLYSKCPWVDGLFRITWVKRETRDGTKEFNATSLPASALPQPALSATAPVDSSASRGRRTAAGGKRSSKSKGEVAPKPGAVFLCPDADGIEGESRYMSGDEDGDGHVSPPFPPNGGEDGVSSQGESCVVPPRAGREGESFGEPATPSRPLAAGGEGRSGESGGGPSDSAPLAKGSRLSPHSEFGEFWVAYPKKRLRDAAWRVWRERKPPLAQCLAAIARLRRTEEWRRDGGRFVPHPANWLSAGGWDDVPEVDLRRRPQGGLLTSGASLSCDPSSGLAESSPAGGRVRPLLPGESVPEPLGDPEVWPDYVALHPELAGKHLRDLSAAEQEAFKDWSFARQREAFLAEKRRMGER